MSDIVRYGGITWTLAKRELAARYGGTLGGPLWAILHPLATFGVFWLVFSVGFKAQGPDGMPFALYFLTGFAPWLMFNEVVSQSVRAVTDNVHLVKKLVFATEVLPVVALVSATLVHAVLVALVVIIAAIYGYSPTLALLQLPYYLVLMGLFALGLGWSVAALNVFYRDLGQVTSVLLNLWFWLTPIVWTPNMVPEDWQWLFAANPLYMVVEGYRGAILYGTVFWADGMADAGYWVGAGIVFAIGAGLFRHLKADFADIL